MADSGQTYKNHARFFPLFHFFVTPILLLNVIVRAYKLYRVPSRLDAWEVVIAITLVGLALAARVMALAVQDRVIRLEMRLRMRELLPPDLQGRINEITREQCVGLRFASDAELPGLVRRVLAGELRSTGDIKKSVTQWQGDYLRA
ncbi:MAG TPA: DUF6526 family protein [Vicinamibacterales bacterium]|nr:DUF6526 family protein [Vicinamibacterales bacterium]